MIGISFFHYQESLRSRIIEVVKMKRNRVAGSFAALVASALLSVLAYRFVKNIRNSTRRRAGDIAGSSSSATSAGSDSYDVFLSFSGKYNRKTFVGHLYNGLVDAGIHVFRDDNDLRQGEQIGNSLFHAIKNSKISIPILSLNYASSNWCLQELVEMIECSKRDPHPQVVLPIFYRVEPAHVRYQKGSFGKNFSRLSGKYVEEDVEKWKQALQEVASLSGWESEKAANGHEGELVKMVVRKVFIELKKAFQLVGAEQLVGIDDAVEDILRLFDENPGVTLSVGIYGMGGIGKTTLAKAVYNKLFDKFHHRSFIADIRESSQRNGIMSLQNQLISDILKINDRISNVDQGIRIMESKFERKKVLILLDDVDKENQIKALIGKHDWFETGSRIIITTRIRSVLDNAGVNCKYKLKEMAEDESLILFSRHSFLRDYPLCGFEFLSRDVVSTTGGLPLALKVIGSFLCGKSRAFWHAALEKFQKIPHEEVQEKLKISYDALNHEEKQIYLDIACFFTGADSTLVSYMWDACKFFPNMEIDMLCFMSLIEIGDYGELKMHDQLRDLGREIVRKEDYHMPMNRSRLWAHEEALEVLQRNKGVEKVCVQALRLFQNGSQNEFTTEQFEMLPNLRFLEVDGAKLIGHSKGLLPKLLWLAWTGGSAFMATSFRLEKLVILNLSRSDVSYLWEGWNHLKVAEQLKVLDLTYCRCLKVSPDLSAFRNLKILIFERCNNLEEIHPSLGEAKGLVVLNLQGCEKIQKLPREMGELEELKELIVRQTAIEEIPPCIGSLKKLEVLDALDCRSLGGLPDSISHLVNLSTLDLRNCIKLCRLPENIGSLVKLQRLLLDGVRALHHIPNSIGQLEWLTELNLWNSGISELPESIGDLQNLKILNIGYNSKLRSLPTTISKLGNLEELDATECEDLEGEVHIDGLSSLKILQLSSTCISGFPDAFDKVSHLEKLDLHDCGMLQSLPQSISKLGFLQHLDLASCESLKSLPELPACLTILKVTCPHSTLPQLSHLIHLRELAVVECLWLESMPELPSGLLKLHVLDCDELKDLPSLSSLTLLSEIDLQSCSELTEIKDLEALRSLVKLNVSKCSNLSNLDGLEQLESLRCLHMRWLDSPPLNDDLFQVRSLDRLKNLEELHLWHCQSLIRPDLSELTHLKKLSTRECHSLVEIKGLEKLKILEKLDVEGCRSLETFPDLLCFNNLKHLNIRGCSQLGDVQGLEKVATVFK